MPRIPTPLTWKRRKFAVFEPMGMIDRLYSVAVSGIVAGPFAIYTTRDHGFHLIHLPSQAKIMSLEMQNAASMRRKLYAACDVNWWTCIPEEVIGPDTPGTEEHPRPPETRFLDRERLEEAGREELKTRAHLIGRGRRSSCPGLPTSLRPSLQEKEPPLGWLVMLEEAWSRLTLRQGTPRTASSLWGRRVAPGRVPN